MTATILTVCGVPFRAARRPDGATIFSPCDGRGTRCPSCSRPARSVEPVVLTDSLLVDCPGCGRFSYRSHA